MSSQASSAGSNEAEVRRKLVENRRCRSHDRHSLQLFLHPHRPLRIVVSQPRQTRNTPRQSTDDRRPQHLSPGHAQNIRLQPRAAAKHPRHCPSLSRRNRAIHRSNIQLPAAHFGRKPCVLRDQRRRNHPPHYPTSSTHSPNCTTCSHHP